MEKFLLVTEDKGDYNYEYWGNFVSDEYYEKNKTLLLEIAGKWDGWKTVQQKRLQILDKRPDELCIDHDMYCNWMEEMIQDDNECGNFF